MTVNYLLVFSFFLYRMYMNLCLVYAWLSSVISYLNYKCISFNFSIRFVDNRSNLQVCVIKHCILQILYYD